MKNQYTRCARSAQEFMWRKENSIQVSALHWRMHINLHIRSRTGKVNKTEPIICMRQLCYLVIRRLYAGYIGAAGNGCNFIFPVLILLQSVSYTHLTLPTNREV